MRMGGERDKESGGQKQRRDWKEEGKYARESKSDGKS